jgi:hypothetical protein
MGPRLKLPKYVHGFVDRHGKPRFYFRRPGFETKRLRGLPYSSEFMRDYEPAMADQPLPVGAGKVRPGTMTALAISYFASPEFRTLRSSTQRAYRGMIDQICRDFWVTTRTLVLGPYITENARRNVPLAENKTR